MGDVIGKNKIWSNMYDTDEVKREIKDIKNRLKIKAFWMIILPPIIAIIYGFIMQKLEIDEMKWWSGLVLALPLEIIFIFYIIKKAFVVNTKPFEATVIKKRKYIKSKRSFLTTFFFGARSDGTTVYETGNHYDVYEIKVKKTSGGKKKLKYRDDRTLYDYVKENDVIRYYPLFDTLEKFDKSKCNKTYCIVCGNESPIANVKCNTCGIRLYDAVSETATNEAIKQEIIEDVWDGKKVTMAKLMTSNYENADEVTEAYYNNGWDKDDTSWQCDCGFWNDMGKCINCGNKKQK